MKTKLILVIVLMWISFLSIQAQSAADKSNDIINIKELVNNQIQEIKNRNSGSSKSLTLLKNKLQKSEVLVSRGTLTKVFLFVEGSIFILLVLYVRRRRIEIKKYELSVLKENIRRMRDEYIGSVSNNNLYQVRRKLRRKIVKTNGRDITLKAKKLAISKGEIHLAAKLNMMMKKAA